MHRSEESAVPSIAIEILGPVRLLVDGEPVPLTAQQRTVVAMLATAEGRRCSVDALALRLWQDALPASGLNALRVLVRSIRRLAPAPFLITIDHAYALTDGVTLDLDEAEAALRSCVAAAAVQDDVVAITWFVEGRQRVRGAVLADVDGDPPEVRSGFEELLLEGLEAATDARIRLGTVDAAMEELLSAAAAHPLRETLQERLVRALSAAGRRAEAVDAYGVARSVIVDRLGIEPGPRLRAAFEQALRTETTAPISDVRTGLHTVPVPLVGRADELRRLHRLLDRHRLVTVIGIGGVGKTRLAQAVVEARPGAAAFASLVGARTDSDAAVTLAGELGVPGSGDMEAALAAALRRVPDDFVLVIDNLEHLQTPGLLLDRLLAAAPRLTILATSRVPLDLPAEIRMTVEPLETTSTARDPSPASVLLLERMRALGELDDPSPADLRALDRIAERCSGLPLALELAAARSTSLSLGEIAEALDTPLEALRDSGRHPDLSLQRTVLEMIRALPDEVAPTLAAAAAFAGGCTIPLLAVAVDRPELVVAEHVGVLRERGLLRRVDAKAEDRRFVVLEVIREVVLADSSPQHAEAAADGQLRAMLRWLRTTATTRDFPRTRAEFARFLDERPNLRVAMRRATAPDDRADLFVLAASGWFRADGAFEHADPLQRLIETEQGFSARRRFDLLIALIRLRGGNGDATEMALLDEAEALGVTDADARGEVLVERAFFGLYDGDMEEAERRTAELEALPQDRLDLSMRAQIGERRSLLTALAGRVDEGVAIARTWIDRCRAEGRELPALMAATNLSDLQLQVGRYDDAAATCAEVIATTHASEHHYRSFALTNRSTGLQLSGRIGDALEAARAALVLQNGTPNLMLALMTTTVAACAHVELTDSSWAVAAGVADEGRLMTGVWLQPAERRLQEIRIPGVANERRYAEGVELVRARGPAMALAEVRTLLLDGR